MPMILGMYILIPFVAIALKEFDGKTLVFPIAIYCFFSFVITPLKKKKKIWNNEISLPNIFSLGFSGGTYGIYIVIGYLIKKQSFNVIKSWILWSLGIISLFAGIVLQMLLYSNNITYNVWYDCFFILIAALSFFVLGSRILRVKLYSIIKGIAYYSFSIFLTHIFFIMLLKNRIILLPVNNPLKVLLLWLLSLLGGLLLSWIINKIPIIGKYILYTK